MERIGLVDLGSNSARLVVYEHERDRGFWLVDEIREVIRLGAGIARSGDMTDGAIRRALSALRSFGDFAAAQGLPPLRIMATSAVRSAGNAERLLGPMRDLGLEIEVLAGESEARLGVIAVANTLPYDEAWVLDLGGGSLQLSRMSERGFVRGRAHPLGTIHVTEEKLIDDPPVASQVEALERAVDDQLGETLDRIAASGLPLVAIGGTVRNLARAVQRTSGYPWRQMHAYELATRGLDELTARLVTRSARGRGRIPGINPYRADIILAGALVIRRVLGRARLTQLTISGFGMREGALLQEILPAPYQVPDVRDFHVRNLLWRYPQPEVHTRRVRALCRQLFDELQPLHGYGEPEAELLDASARLHDIGKSIHFRDHAKHGAYLLSGAPLPGFDHREQALLSLLVRYHRGGKPSRAPYRPLMQEGDGRRLAQLGVCLLLAEYLERSRTGRIHALRARIEEHQVVLEIRADGEPWVELSETRKQAPRFESAFQRRLRLELSPG